MDCCVFRRMYTIGRIRAVKKCSYRIHLAFISEVGEEEKRVGEAFQLDHPRRFRPFRSYPEAFEAWCERSGGVQGKCMDRMPLLGVTADYARSGALETVQKCSCREVSHSSPKRVTPQVLGGEGHVQSGRQAACRHGSFTQDDGQKRAVDLQSTVVLDETEFTKSVHEKTDS